MTSSHSEINGILKKSRKQSKFDNVHPNRREMSNVKMVTPPFSREYNESNQLYGIVFSAISKDYFGPTIEYI